jgi:hypothetical protein
VFLVRGNSVIANDSRTYHNLERALIPNQTSLYLNTIRLILQGFAPQFSSRIHHGGLLA